MNSNINGKKKLRVLCLHGYRQNAEIFRQKTGALRKVLKSRVEFEFISAPLTPNLPPKSTGNVEDEDNDQQECTAAEQLTSRAWWFSNRELQTFSSKEHTETADGFEESVEAVVECLRDQGPFDGLLGFSQGASFIHLLLASQQQIRDQQIRFVILFSGFKSLSAVHRPLMDELLAASLHICGLSDEIVLHNRSEELAKMFDRAELVTHPGKHCIPPMKEEVRDKLVQFFDQFLS